MEAMALLSVFLAVVVLAVGPRIRAKTLLLAFALGPVLGMPPRGRLDLPAGGELRSLNGNAALYLRGLAESAGAVPEEFLAWARRWATKREVESSIGSGPTLPAPLANTPDARLYLLFPAERLRLDPLRLPVGILLSVGVGSSP